MKEPPFCDAVSLWLLHRALSARRPPIAVKRLAVEQWWQKYRSAGGQALLQNAKQFEENYGDLVRKELQEQYGALMKEPAFSAAPPTIILLPPLNDRWMLDSNWRHPCDQCLMQ